MQFKKIIAIVAMILFVTAPVFGDAETFNAGYSDGSGNIADDPKNTANSVKVEYWKNGKMRVLTESNYMDNVVAQAFFRNDGTLEEEKTFDPYGNKKSIAYFSSEGDLQTSPDGWAAIMWKYEDGVIRGEGYYDSDGHLTRYKVYNAGGDLVDEKYVGDQDPDPNELYSSRYAVTNPKSFEFYDSYGRPEGKVTSYRVDGWFPYSYPFWYYSNYPDGYIQ